MDETLKSCREFTEALASASPTPGGGGAAAMMGALGAALGCMVANLTVGKPRYAEHETQMKAALETLQSLREELLELVQKDADGFAPLAKAYRLPEGDPIREAATAAACDAPLRMLRACRKALEAVAVTAKYGSVYALSDAACAASCLRAAMECASYNVTINTAALKDRAAAALPEEEAARLLAEGTAKAGEILADYLK